MAVYWLTFRIENDATYQRRYEKLYDIIRDRASQWWVESTSFLVFQSDDTIDDLATLLKAGINQQADLVLIGMPDFKTARVIGTVTDDDIFKLIPFAKHV